MFNFIDTHTHIDALEYDGNRAEIIQNAIQNGVTRLYIPSLDSTQTQKMYAVKEQFPDTVFLMIGLHPCYVKDNYEMELQHVENELSKHKFIAIGEIGIDLYWDKSTLEIQKKAFRHQIQLAKKHQLPINIHCRDAFDEVFEILELEKGENLFGIFHCFSGTYEQALKAISYNMKLGIGGVVTFKNGKIDHFLNQIPLDNIVLETDSPYLAPVPYRGKQNQSSYLPLIAEKLSEIYKIPITKIAEITTKNALDIYE